MAIHELDISVSEPNDTEAYSLDMELDGTVYTLDFLWNRRDESWVMSVYLPDGTLLAGNRKLVLGFPLLRGEIDSRLPPGVLILVDSTESNDEPERDEVGGRCFLAYLDEEEVAA
jgi:hypothetical protein